MKRVVLLCLFVGMLLIIGCGGTEGSEEALLAEIEADEAEDTGEIEDSEDGSGAIAGQAVYSKKADLCGGDYRKAKYLGFKYLDCEDTDGSDKYQAGIVTYKRERNYKCPDGTVDQYITVYAMADRYYKKSGKLYEFTCKAELSDEIKRKHPRPYGYVTGLCADGVDDEYLKYKDASGNEKKKRSYACIAAGEVEEESTEAAPQQEARAEPGCADTDPDNNAALKGEVTNARRPDGSLWGDFTDSCSPSGQLIEVNCAPNGQLSSYTHPCATDKVCRNGICLAPPFDSLTCHADRVKTFDDRNRYGFHNVVSVGDQFSIGNDGYEYMGADSIFPWMEGANGIARIKFISDGQSRNFNATLTNQPHTYEFSLEVGGQTYKFANASTTVIADWSIMRQCD